MKRFQKIHVGKKGQKSKRTPDKVGIKESAFLQASHEASAAFTELWFWKQFDDSFLVTANTDKPR